MSKKLKNPFAIALRKYLSKDTVAFQVALQTIDLRPRNLRRLIETGYAMYRGTEKAANPVFLHIEPTGLCNLKCPMCPRTEAITREMQHMNFNRFKTIVDVVDPVFVAFVGFGEPLMNPQTVDMVTYAASKGRTTRISTNGTTLNQKTSERIIGAGLNQIWISIDSPDPNTFSKIRVGATLPKVVENVKQFVEIKDRTRSRIAITVNYTITADNIDDVPAMVDFCFNELGIEPTFAMGYTYDIEEQQSRKLRPTEDTLSSLSKAAKTAIEHGQLRVAENIETIMYDLKHPLHGTGPCYFPYYVVAVSWDGRISPCCLFYDYQMNLGEISEHTSDREFNRMWNGPAYQKFRIQLKRNRKKLKICNTCTLNDISLHNTMNKITRIPGAKLLTKERYEYIQRGVKKT